MTYVGDAGQVSARYRRGPSSTPGTTSTVPH